MTAGFLRAGTAAVVALAVVAAPAGAAQDRGAKALKKVRHFVVIYQENHSFDNLYGRWERVDGVRRAPAARTMQVNQAGQPYQCLLQNDVNLSSPPLSATCTNTNPPFTSHFPNTPFLIDDYLQPTDTTCPAPGQSASNGVPKGTGLPGGCTRDLVHRFYEEQYQLNGGKQNRYVTGSDAVGLTMGTYATRRLPIYRYLHRKRHPRYAISDRFFQAAFGGSFLNHQWLVAAATPIFTGAVNDGSSDDLHSRIDANGMPAAYPLYTPAGPVKNAQLTVPCNTVPADATTACGDYAVNTIQPPYQPYSPGTAAARRLPPQTHPTIGDRLSAKGVSWAWYAGGWSNANGDLGAPGWTNGQTPGTCTDPDTATNAVWPNCPSKLFQYHHQPLNYFAAYAPGTAARRRHLRDEAEFESLAAASKRSCKLRSVSFVKPIGAENEHPGYASEHNGSDHLVELLRAVRASKCRRNTMIIVTYDEFGGQWDHVPPPGQGGSPGPHDNMGPGTRIPALTIAPRLKQRFRIDHRRHDTTSIMATLERRYRLRPVATRDAAVKDLTTIWGGRG